MRKEITLIIQVNMVFILIYSMIGCGGYLGRKPLTGYWYNVQSGDTLTQICQEAGVHLDDVVELNQISNPSVIQMGQKLFIPSAQAFQEMKEMRTDPTLTDDQHSVSVSTVSIPMKRLRALQWPLKHIDVSSGFGQRESKTHKGLDLRAKEGTSVFAVLSGEVTQSNYNKGGYGWIVIIDHGDGLESRYAHHKKNRVKVGQKISQGELVGEVGSTGRSTGPHLHFELRLKGKALNPLDYLPAIP